MHWGRLSGKAADDRAVAACFDTRSALLSMRVGERPHPEAS